MSLQLFVPLGINQQWFPGWQLWRGMQKVEKIQEDISDMALIN